MSQEEFIKVVPQTKHLKFAKNFIDENDNFFQKILLINDKKNSQKRSSYVWRKMVKPSKKRTEYPQ